MNSLKKANEARTLKAINKLYRFNDGTIGSVKPGAKSQIVCFYRSWNTQDRSTGEDIKIPVLRYYRVFNIQDTTLECPEITNTQQLSNFTKIKNCEMFVDYFKDKPVIQHGKQQAYYLPSEDIVNMPPKLSFKSEQQYYNVLFHELAHSTGHEKRLNRKGVTGKHNFGSYDYGIEELIAEMTASFCCGHNGILNHTLNNSSGYIASWLSVIKKDKNMVIKAASYADKAFQYMNKDH